MDSSGLPFIMFTYSRKLRSEFIGFSVDFLVYWDVDSETLLDWVEDDVLNPLLPGLV